MHNFKINSKYFNSNFRILSLEYLCVFQILLKLVSILDMMALFVEKDVPHADLKDSVLSFYSAN